MLVNRIHSELVQRQLENRVGRGITPPTYSITTGYFVSHPG